jgi:hypothetical protein
MIIVAKKSSPRLTDEKAKRSSESMRRSMRLRAIVSDRMTSMALGTALLACACQIAKGSFGLVAALYLRK